MHKKVIEIDSPEYGVFVEKRISELRTTGKFVAETAHVTKDGKVIPTEISSRFIQYYGVPAIFTAARDITERKKTQTELQKAYDDLEERVDKRTADLRQTNVLLRQEIAHRKETEKKLRQSETRYRDLVESSNSIVLEMDKNGNLIFINKFGLNYFGYRESDILGQNVVGTIVPETDSSGNDLQLLIQDILHNPNKYSSSENENMRKNGERVWVAWTNKAINNPETGQQEILCIGIDRTEQKRSQERLAEEMQARVAAEERNSLARDLHDAVSQTLFSASLIAEVLPRLWERNQDEGRKRLEEVRQLSRGAFAEMRMLLLELRPATLIEASLGDLLKQISDAAVSKLGVPVTLTVEGQSTLPPQVQIAFYRVAQEALNNIQKHSSARRVGIKLEYQSGSVNLIIRDDGIGFDPSLVSGHHLGLSIMKERASAAGACLNIDSEIGKGTQINMIWPDPQLRRDDER